MKTIIEMAREAGLESEGYWEFDLIRFKRFAALVRADEREVVIDWIRNNYQDHNIASLCDAIRARGK